MRRNAGLFVAISLLSGFGSSAMSLVAGIWILDLTGSGSLAALAGALRVRPGARRPVAGRPARPGAEATAGDRRSTSHCPPSC